MVSGNPLYYLFDRFPVEKRVRYRAWEEKRTGPPPLKRFSVEAIYPFGRLEIGFGETRNRRRSAEARPAHRGSLASREIRWPRVGRLAVRPWDPPKRSS